MALEDSPKLDGTSTSSGGKLTQWVYTRRRAILITDGLLFTLLVMFVLLQFLAARPPDLYVGGLDGCLISEDGSPVTATIQIADFSAATYEDGCFFFAALPPGEHLLKGLTEEGFEWTQSAAIASGEATGLGEIVVSH